MQVPGPVHPINVRFVSQRTLHKHGGRRKATEQLRGLYDEDKNVIYVLSSMSQEEQLHILFHEIAHAIEFQTSGMEEEGRMDVIGKYLRELAGITTMEGLKNGTRNRN